MRKTKYAPGPNFVGYGTDDEIAFKHKISSASHLAQNYGISKADYADLYERQEGSCPICEKFFIPLVVDHKHREGEACTPDDVRGLLCSQCNTALGHFRDSPGRLASGVGYLIFFDEKDYCWNGNNACHVCRDPRVRLTDDLVEGEWRGRLCSPCLRGIRLFYRSAHSLRMALCYLLFYEHRPKGEPYWRNSSDGIRRYGNLCDETPEELLAGDWWVAQSFYCPNSGNKQLGEALCAIID